jgi:hypothetical protein
MEKQISYEKYSNLKFNGGINSSNIPVEKIVEKIPVEKIVEKIPVEKIVEKIPVEKIVENKLDSQTINTLPVVDSSTITLYTISKGTILYHGTQTKETFNPDKIDLSNTTRVAFFTPNKRFASDYIEGCANYPSKNGFIHKFEVNIDIDNIYIYSQYDRNVEWVLESIEKKFCNNKDYGYLNGIGYFINEIETKKFGSDEKSIGNELFNSEFALCYPTKYLTYISTEKCMSIRKLSEPYQFNA